MDSLAIRAVKHYGRLTQNAGTKIVRCIEPSKGTFTELLFAEIITAATEHILTVMKPLGKTSTSASAATGQAVINLTADPGNYAGWGTADNLIATSDFCAVECEDGLIHFGTVTMSTLEATFATNLPAAVESGADVWWYGVETDVNPIDGLAHPRFTLAASGRTTLGDIAGGFGFMHSNRREEPILMVIDNGTNASTLDRVSVAYGHKNIREWTRKTQTYTPTVA